MISPLLLRLKHSFQVLISKQFKHILRYGQDLVGRVQLLPLELRFHLFNNQNEQIIQYLSRFSEVMQLSDHGDFWSRSCGVWSFSKRDYLSSRKCSIAMSLPKCFKFFFDTPSQLNSLFHIRFVPHFGVTGQHQSTLTKSHMATFRCSTLSHKGRECSLACKFTNNTLVQPPKKCVVTEVAAKAS